MYNLTDINGAKFIFSPFKGVETASLGLFFKAGARFEKSRLKGISHYLEHMFFKGSKKYSHRRITRDIEGRGGALNGFTSQEITGYYAHFLKKNFKTVLNILADMVLNPLLKETDVEKERRVILEEIKMYNDLPACRASAVLDKLLWPGHCLGEDVAGYPATVDRITRDDLINFQNNFYYSGNMVVSFCADYDYEQAVSLVRERISSVKIAQRGKSAAPRPLKGVYIRAEKKDYQQAHLCLGFRSVSYFSREKFIVDLINVILGANMSSRLFEEIREKKALCYDISTEVKKYKETGAFVIHIGLDKTKIITALGSVITELKKLQDKEVSSVELARAKDYFLGQSAMALEQPAGRMFFLGERFLKLGKVSDFNEIRENISRLTPAQIQDFSRKIFRFDDMCVSCIGDFSDGAEAMEESIRIIVNSQ